MNKRYSKEEVSTIIRKNVKKYRKMQNMTLQELADKCSLTHGYIRDLDSLKIEKTPSIDTLTKIAKALQIDIKLLFDDK